LDVSAKITAAAEQIEQPRAPSAGVGGLPRARYVLTVLLAIYTLNFLDRQIVSILAAPIKADLGLSNTELGLITGLAFAIFYSTLGLPIAWAADRFNRVHILAGACALWSIMTALCGASTNFIQLFFARIGVGVGEAACVPTSHSLISSYEPKETRAAALAIFAMGISFGTLAGLALGGVVADAFGWRAAFFVLGVPGVLLAMLTIVTIKEPRKTQLVATAAPPFRQAISELLGASAYRHLTAGAALASLGGYGLVAFLGVYFVEAFSLSLTRTGVSLGFVIGVGGALGAWAGGYLSTRYDDPDRAPRFPAIGLFCAAPFLLATVLAGGPNLAFGFLLVVAIFNAFWYGPVFAAIQGLAQERSRAMAAALFNLAVNLIGLGLGPLIIGAFSDAAGLKWGLASAVIFNLWAAAHFLWARKVTAAATGDIEPYSQHVNKEEIMTSNKTTGANALISALADEGVRFCFSNPGTSELDLVLALDHEPRVKSVPVLFEGVAAGAADGYARMTGTPAATLLHLGPGYLNAAAQLHNARRAKSPVVNIIGDHAVSHLVYDTPLQSDLDAIAAPQSSWVRRVNAAEHAEWDAREAVREAKRQHGQATLIVAADAAWNAAEKVSSDGARDDDEDAGSDDINAVAAAIRRASYPAMLVGGSALSDKGLAACARLSAAGVRILRELFPACQARGGGRFEPENLQYFTEAAIEQLGETDLVVAAGTNEPAGMFAYPGRPARPLPAGALSIPLKARRNEVVSSLFALADALDAPKSFANRKDAEAAADQPSGPINPQTIGVSLRRHLPENAIVSDDGVTASGFAFAATAGSVPHDWLSLTGGALGQGMPVAIGAACAAPDRKVICLTGDGAAMYSIQSLWTMAREELDILVIVAANRSYEVLKYELSRMGDVNAGADTMAMLSIGDPTIDFCFIAKGLGVEARRCETAEGFNDALAGLMGTKGPALIEAVYGG